MVKQNNISQHKNCYISEMPEYFCIKFRSFVCHNTVHKCIALCCIYLTYVKLTETQTSRTNFTTEQKVDFIFKVTEQQVLYHLCCDAIIFMFMFNITMTIFQVIVAVRPITLVMGKISYKGKARIKTLQRLGFRYRTIVAKFPENGWKLCSVKAICKQADERGSATEQKQHKQRKMLDTLNCWLAKIEHWLWCCATSPNIKLIE